MKILALMICRNSEWSIKAVASHAMQYCDGIVALCHACTDNTEEILRGLGAHVISVSGDGWEEMNHRQKTLEAGRENGGTHFLILDDDEMLTHNLVPSIRDLAGELQPGELWQMPMYNCWRDLDHVRCDPRSVFSLTWKSTFFRDHPLLGWQSKDGYQHHHTHPYYSSIRRNYVGDGGWLHFQHAQWDRLVVKQCWYMAMELCRYGKIVANYRGTLQEKGLERRPVPAHWWPPQKKEIDLLAVPWQYWDLKRMVEDKGKEFFEAQRIPITAIFEHWDNELAERRRTIHS